MKHMRIICLLFAGAIYQYTITNNPFVVPYFSIRSQGVNTPRHAVGTVDHIHDPSAECVYGFFTATPAFNKSFCPDAINECLFGAERINHNSIKISGSRVANRDPRDLMADQFYLPTDYESIVSFTPTIENYLVDFYLYVDLTAWACGLYFEAFGPMVHTIWDLHADECVINPGGQNYDPGYFTPDTLDRKYMMNSFLQYASGYQLPSVTQNFPVNAMSTSETRTIFNNLRAAKISPEPLATTRLADIHAVLGWNHFYHDVHHVGFGFVLSLPTGNRPDGKYLFEPIAGNGHHWEFGGKLHSLITLFESTDCNTGLYWYTDVYVTHFFKAEQFRTFDLTKNGNLSRYMLAERLALNVTSVDIDGTATPFTLMGDLNGDLSFAIFNQEFVPVANLARRKVGVGIAVQGEITTMLSYITPHWEIDFGYNFWARSKEGIQPLGANTIISQSALALITGASSFESQLLRGLKGDAYVYGYTDPTMPMVGDTLPIPLAPTESCATIHSGTNLVDGQTIDSAKTNPNIDNPELANSTINGMAIQPLFATPDKIDRINTSIQPVILGLQDLALEPTESTALSHKFFGHISYTWTRPKKFVPFLGVGFEVEFHKNRPGTCDAVCPTGPRYAISQWGVWAKGGIEFH